MVSMAHQTSEELNLRSSASDPNINLLAAQTQLVPEYKLTNIDMNEAFGRQGLCLAGRQLFGRCQGRCLGILQIT